MADCSRYEIGLNAYVKIVLHALKHKSCAVNGVLIGKLPAADAEKTESVQVIDAVPLSHGQLGLLPTFELALMQVEQHFSSKPENLGVVGYYHANERYDDCELNFVAKKIGDHIARYCSQPAICLVDNKLLEELPKSGSTKPVLQLFTRDASKGWRQAGLTGNTGQVLAFNNPNSNSILWDYITEGKEQNLVDFDEHLDDVSKDWTNAKIVS